MTMLLLFTSFCVFNLIDDKKLNAYGTNMANFDRKFLECFNGTIFFDLDESNSKDKAKIQAKSQIPMDVLLSSGQDFIKIVFVCVCSVACLATNRMADSCGSWMTQLTKVWQRPNFVNAVLFCSGLFFMYYVHEYANEYKHISAALKQNSAPKVQSECNLKYEYERNFNPVDVQYELNSSCTTYNMNFQKMEQYTLNSVFQLYFVVPDAENFLLRLHTQTEKHRIDALTHLGILITLYFVARAFAKKRTPLTVDMDILHILVDKMSDSPMKFVLSNLKSEAELYFIMFMITVTETENFDDMNIQYVSMLCQTYFHIIMTKGDNTFTFQEWLTKHNTKKGLSPRTILEHDKLRFVSGINETNKKDISKIYTASLLMIRNMAKQFCVIDESFSGGSCNDAWPYFAGYSIILLPFVKFEQWAAYTCFYVSFCVYLEIITLAHLEKDLLDLFRKGVNSLENYSDFKESGDYITCLLLLKKLFQDIEEKGWKEALMNFAAKAETECFHHYVDMN